VIDKPDVAGQKRGMDHAPREDADRRSGPDGKARAGQPPQESRGRFGLLQPISAGLLTAVVGFSSTFALVLQGFSAAGATREEAASGLLALLVATGILAIGFGWATRMPISIAWSTPGAALLVATGVRPGGFPVATGAFLTAAGLIVAAGLWRPLGRAVAAIPLPLASAMLAGILLDLCFAPVRAVAALPGLALPIVIAWALTWRFARIYAVPVAVVATALVVGLATQVPAGALAEIAPRLVPVVPRFTPDAIAGIAIPLFIVTMASQNVPGLGVLAANGYRPPVRPIFVATGLASAVGSLFGAHLVNLAAITAALAAGPDAHPDPARRWIASVTSGVGYVLLGLGASFAAAFVAASPPLLIQALAGLALLGSLAAALQTALAREEDRIPAIITFVVTASGVSYAGVGPAFWGLAAGLAMTGLGRIARPPVP
jgi:benzoate membrane transport protein